MHNLKSQNLKAQFQSLPNEVPSFPFLNVKVIPLKGFGFKAVACLFFFLHLFGCCFHFQTPYAPTSTFSFALRLNPEQAVWLKGETDLREISRGRWRSKQNRNRGRFQEQQA